MKIRMFRGGMSGSSARRIMRLMLAGLLFVPASIEINAQEQRFIRTAADAKSGIEPEYFSTRVTPADDFYEYVNQGWLDRTEIPGDRADYGTFGILNDRTQEQVRALIEKAAETEAASGTDAQKVGDFYRSYTDLATRNTNGLKAIRPLLDQIDAVDSPAALAKTMADLLRSGVAGPWVMYVSPDARKSDEYALYIYQSGLTLPDREYYLRDDENFVKLREEFVNYVGKLLEHAGVANAKQVAQKHLELETELARIQWTRVENRDPVATYNKKSAAELRTILGNFDWNAYANAGGVQDATEYILKQPTYLEALNKLYTDFSLDVWKNFLKFHTLDAYASMATEELDQLHFDFHDTAVKGVQEQEPLWKRGVQATGGVVGELVGKLYVDAHFSPEAKERMQELVENLKQAFAKRIEQLDWMGDGTKKQALEKLSQFTTKIGYPDKWKDYDALTIQPDDLLGNAVRSSRFEYQDSLDKLGGPIDRTEWGMTPQTINAYYNPVMNEIVFPAAILQPPFFDLQADDAVNYGAIGAVIGHEISHGFDDKGSKYDGQGNLRDWWTPEDREVFEQRAQQLVLQYGNYRPFEDMAVNGELTLGENIGDLGGLSVALEAYQISLQGKPASEIDGTTGLQRFFYGWSQIWRRKYREPELRRRLLNDPHSPSRYRVNGIVSNMDTFYEAFKVEPTDPMYIAPEKRVRIW